MVLLSVVWSGVLLLQLQGAHASPKPRSTKPIAQSSHAQIYTSSSAGPIVVSTTTTELSATSSESSQSDSSDLTTSTSQEASPTSPTTSSAPTSSDPASQFSSSDSFSETQSSQVTDSMTTTAASTTSDGIVVPISLTDSQTTTAGSDDGGDDGDNGDNGDNDDNDDDDGGDTSGGDDGDDSGGDDGGDSGSDDGGVDPSKVTDFVPVSASVDAPSNPDTVATISNSQDPSQTVTIAQGQLPEDQGSQIPAFGLGDSLPIKLTVGGQEKPARVDVFGRLSLPMDGDSDWITINDLPEPAAIGTGSDGRSGDSCNLPASMTEGASTTTTDSSSPTTTTTDDASTTTSTETPSPTLNCQQNIESDGPSPSQVSKALQDDSSFSSFCDDNESAGSLYQSMQHGMLEISAMRQSPDDELKYCKDGLQDILDTCINSNSDYGGIYEQDGEVYNITNLIAPSNPLEVDVDDGAPTAPITNGNAAPAPATTTAYTPPMPTETDGNNKGSSLCKTLAGTCIQTYKLFNDNYIYKDYTYYSRGAGLKDDVNWAIPFANNGCKVEYKCDDYGEGMSGAQIKQAVENMFESDDVEECGTTYLSNSCEIKMNGCDTHCGYRVPCGALEGDQSDYIMCY
ncbi:hypothetical protein PENSTE_c026G09735 [Penicillium steckii]|uniref:Uncharacterized protein n=1 Tax=Penicillium steckii TaxID=303698 RepID=A0A1V6SQA3_9EURO|nr:hypothetical protein PENSTE_c026G09735 [Penicillium steckii]